MTSHLSALTRIQINALSRKILDAAMRVHSELGPGFLESAYEACLAYELRDFGLKVESWIIDQLQCSQPEGWNPTPGSQILNLALLR